jgi:hypothetical protein
LDFAATEEIEMSIVNWATENPKDALFVVSAIAGWLYHKARGEKADDLWETALKLGKQVLPKLMQDARLYDDAYVNAQIRKTIVAGLARLNLKLPDALIDEAVEHIHGELAEQADRVQPRRVHQGAEADRRAARGGEVTLTFDGSHDRGERPLPPLEAVGRLLYRVGEDMPYTLGTERDCAGVVCAAYKLTRHRQGFARGKLPADWAKFADVEDDINTNSMIKDALINRELFRFVPDGALLAAGDLLAYPTIRIKDADDGEVHTFIGHVQMVLEPNGGALVVRTRPSRSCTRTARTVAGLPSPSATRT